MKTRKYMLSTSMLLGLLFGQVVFASCTLGGTACLDHNDDGICGFNK